MKKHLKAFTLALALLGANAQADLLTLKFEGGKALKPITVDYQKNHPASVIVNGRTVTALVNGGTDRIVKVTIYRANGALEKDFPGRLLSPDNRISYAGQSFYGAAFTHTLSGPGDYVLAARLLQNNGTPIKEERIKIKLDETPPSAGSFYFKGPYKKELHKDGSIERSFGDWSVDFANPNLKWGVLSRIEASMLSVENVSDDTGIKRVRFKSYIVDDPRGDVARAYMNGQTNVNWKPYANLDAAYNSKERRAHIGTGGYYTVNARHFPNSRVLAKAVFEIEDMAGNITRKEQVFSWFGSDLPEARPQPVYVFTLVDQNTKSLPVGGGTISVRDKALEMARARLMPQQYQFIEYWVLHPDQLAVVERSMPWYFQYVVSFLNRYYRPYYIALIRQYPSGVIPLGDPDVNSFKGNPIGFARQRYREFVSRVKSGQSAGSLISGAYSKWFHSYNGKNAVYTNQPIVVYRIPKWAFSKYNKLFGSYMDWQLTGRSDEPDWEDGQYVYKAISAPYLPGTNAMDWPSRGGRTDFTWRSFPYIVGTPQIINPAYQPPRITKYRVRFADGKTFEGRYYTRFAKKGDVFDLTELTFFVEPRPYEQLVRSLYWGGCTVPANGTQCSINLAASPNRVYPPRDPRRPYGIYHAWKMQAFKKSDLSVASARTGLELFWDESPLVFNGYERSGDSLAAHFVENGAGAFWNNIRFERAQLELLSAGRVVASARPLTTETLSSNTTVKWNLRNVGAGLPDGIYALQVKAWDHFNNLTTVPLKEELVIDNTPPTIKFLDAQKRAISSKQISISKLQDIYLSIKDNLSADARVLSVNFQGGPENINISVPLIPTGTQGVYRVDYPMLFPSKALGTGATVPYRITATAVDAGGNQTAASIGLVYNPTTVDLNDGKVIKTPAVSAPFFDGFGNPVIQSSPIPLGDGTLLKSTYRIYATLSQNSPEPLYIEGHLVKPGQTVQVSDGYDFGRTGSRLMLSVYPANGRDAAGKADMVMFTIVSPNSPVVRGKVTFWRPHTDLQVPKGEIVQAFTRFKAKPVSLPGNECRPTLSEEKARKADMLRDPLCLLRFVEKPATLDLTEDESGNIEILGRLYDIKDTPIAYETVIFDANGGEHTLEYVEKVVRPVSAYGKAAISLLDTVTGQTARSLKRVIDNSPIKIVLGGQVACRLTTSEESAKLEALDRNLNQDPLCYLSTVQAPVKTRIEASGGQEAQMFVSGISLSQERVPFSWKLYVFDPNERPILINDQAFTLTAQNPDPIVADDGVDKYAQNPSRIPKDAHGAPTYVKIGNTWARVVRIAARGSYEDDITLRANPSPAMVDVWGIGNVQSYSPEFSRKDGPVNIKGVNYYYADMIRYPFSSEKAEIWKLKKLYVQSAYNLLPDVKYHQVMNVYIAPNTDLRPIAEFANGNQNGNELLSDENIQATLELATIGQQNGTYDPKVHGRWTYTVYLRGPAGMRIPVGFNGSPAGTWQTIGSTGKAVFTVNAAEINRAIRLMDAKAKQGVYSKTLKAYLDRGYDRTQAEQKAQDAVDKYTGITNNLAWSIDADVKLIAPLSEFAEVRSLAYPLTFVWLPAGPITGKISGDKISGPVPFRFGAKLNDITRVERKVLKSVEWLVSSDGGATFVKQPARSKTDLNFYTTFTKPGRYIVKARITNAKTGKVSETNRIEITTYDKPGQVVLKGFTTAFVGTPVTVEAQMRKRVIKVDPKNGRKYFDYEYLTGSNLLNKYSISWSKDGKSWTAANTGQSNLYQVTSPGKPGRIKIFALARNKAAKAGDKQAEAKGATSISFAEPKSPYIRIYGPYKPETVLRRLPDGTTAEVTVDKSYSAIEAGKEYRFRVSVVLPYRNMKGTASGTFIMPDGTQHPIGQNEQVITYVPTEQDVHKGYIYFDATAWVNGYREQSERTITRKVKAWQYIFPEFDMYVRQNTSYAPADVSLDVRPIGLVGQLDSPQYQWLLPPQVEIVRQGATSAKLKFHEAGTYTVSMKVTDARGNKALVSKTITLKPAPALVPEIKYSQSNEYSRAPLDLVLRTYVGGGHPYDRVVEYIYYLDGKEISKDDSYITRATLDAGHHVISVKVNSRFGKTATASISMDVVPNKPPVCSLERKNYSTSWVYIARCSDSDGKVVGYSWTLNGEPLVIGSSSISVSKKQGMSEPSVTVRAKDDAGDYSAPARN